MAGGLRAAAILTASAAFWERPPAQLGSSPQGHLSAAGFEKRFAQSGARPCVALSLRTGRIPGGEERSGQRGTLLCLPDAGGAPRSPPAAQRPAALWEKLWRSPSGSRPSERRRRLEPSGAGASTVPQMCSCRLVASAPCSAAATRPCGRGGEQRRRRSARIPPPLSAAPGGMQGMLWSCSGSSAAAPPPAPPRVAAQPRRPRL